MKHRNWLGVLSLLVMAQTGMAADKEALQQADFVSLPGDEIQIRLTFDHGAPDPSAYKIDKPARLVFDFPNTHSALPGKYFSLGSGNARSMTVVESNDRARLTVSLGELTGFATQVKGNQLFITIGKAEMGLDSGQMVASKSASPAQVAAAVKAINNIDFRRGEQGDGQILIDLSQSTIPVDVQQQGNRITARFLGAKLPEKLRRRLDVTDFATPVKSVDAYNDNGNGVIVIEPQAEFEYLAYQTDSKMTISVKPLTKEAKRQKEFTYTGEKLSLNFQDIDVRTVLQLIADFTSMNLVASDTVSGKITLRLQNVPWDQALDLILKTKGLDKRTVGNVMLVAPADEIAKREQLELQANNQTEQLAPLHTEFLQINYAKAQDLVVLINGTSSGAQNRLMGVTRLLSDRGSVTADARTNTLILVDTAKKIDEIRDIITKLDIPVRQVMIESRIVKASSTFNKQLGVSWGVAHSQVSGSNTLVAGNNTTGIIAGNTAPTYTVDQLTGALVQSNPLTAANVTAVDLGVSGAGVSSLAVGLINADNLLLDLELSALQSEGHGEVVATPKILTADKQKARVSSGSIVPYPTSTSSGATAVAYADAELALDVTPSITPDGRISMDLSVDDDSVGSSTVYGLVINTNRLNTHVVVDDGQTVVLGGIYQDSKTSSVTKTPFLGDIPYLGRLFSQHIDTDEKDELLIFVTPRLVTDAIATK